MTRNNLNYILLLLFAMTSIIHAQRFAERMVIFNPLFNDEKNAGEETIWINTVSGWGEFGGYLYDQDNKHAWYQKLGTFMEFFRTSDKSSLSVIGNIEFIADPHNEINFNPRAIFWEEAFLYTERTGKNFWQAGYYHRCKHDIDNLSYGTERSLIYGSLLGRYIQSYNIGRNTMAYAALKGEFYTLLQDYRVPYSSEQFKPDLTDLIFSAVVNLNIKKVSTESLGFYFSSFSQINFYSGKNGYFQKLINVSDVNFNSGIELGIYFSGNARFNIGLRYEYFSDTGLEVHPEQSHLLSLGVSLQPLEIW